jgi:uncharacterized protein (DUF2267 family)
MATTGLEVFDRTLHTTNVWLDEITAEIGPDRHLAWHVLGSVLRSIRDEMLVEQSAHFAAQLPLLVRGAYFDQYRPAAQPSPDRSQEEFIARIQHDLDGARPVKAEDAAAAVMQTLNRHVTEGQIKKVRDALPKGVRALWPEPEHKAPEHKAPEHGKSGQEKSGQEKSSQEKSGQGAKGAEPPRAAGQAPGGRPPQQQHSEPQRAAPQQSAPQHAAPPPSAPQHVAPPPSAPPRPASHHPEPRHAAPQRAASQHATREEPEIEEIFEEIIEEVDVDDEEETSATSKSSSKSSKGAHVPMGASSRPAKVDAAPGGEHTTGARKPKSRTKRPDDSGSD